MKFIVDKDIPFIKSRLEPFGEVEYISQDEFTRDRVKDADALLVRTRTRCNAELLEGSNVKCVATGTIGTDHLDFPWLEKAGIEAYNAPGCNAPGVAQYVWTSLLRTGFNPTTDTLGVIGYGNVGKIVVEWGEALGAEILVNDPPLEKSGVCADREFVSLEELLKKSDAVTLHVPHTFTGEYPTHHLLGDTEVALLSDSATLINASRGGVVDEKSLYNRDDLRLIIDTWEGEPHINPETLRRAVIATPHIAGYSLEGKQRATRMILEAVGRFFSISPDVSDLPTPYQVPEHHKADFAANIMRTAQSVWPMPDNESQREEMLKDFDRIRAAYNFRSEVSL